MDRRGFFKALAGTTVGAAVMLALPELDLWTPRHTYFLPPKGGWANGAPLQAGDIVTFSNKEGFWIIGDRTTELWTWGKDSFLDGLQWTPAEQQRMLRLT